MAEPKKKALPPIPPPKPRPAGAVTTSNPPLSPTVSTTPAPVQPAPQLSQSAPKQPTPTFTTSLPPAMQAANTSLPSPTSSNSPHVGLARMISPRAQPSRQGGGLQASRSTPQVPAKPGTPKSRTPGWMKKDPQLGGPELDDDFWENLHTQETGDVQQTSSPKPLPAKRLPPPQRRPEPEPEPEPIPEPEPEPEPVNSDESISEGGTGYSEKIMELKAFKKVESEVDAFHGSDKDERSEWTKLAEKAQSGRSQIANQVIKEHIRLIRISGKGKQITLSQVPTSASSLCLSEVYILDTGPVVYQWDGQNAGTFLKNKANWFLKMLRDERQGKFQTIILDWDDNNDKFYEILGGKPDSFPETNEEPGWVPVLYRVTVTVKGNLHFHEVGSGVGTVHKELLKTKGVFLYDLGFEIMMWEGKQAFRGVRDYVLQHAAEEFKTKYERPQNILVSRVKEGGLNPVFNAFIGQM